jgi:hypothetical protein
VLFLRKRLAHAVLQNVSQIPNERVYVLYSKGKPNSVKRKLFAACSIDRTFIKSFSLDENDFVLDLSEKLWRRAGNRQPIYAPPSRGEEKERKGNKEVFSTENFESLSESLDNFYLKKKRNSVFRFVRKRRHQTQTGNRQARKAHQKAQTGFS